MDRTFTLRRVGVTVGAPPALLADRDSGRASFDDQAARELSAAGYTLAWLEGPEINDREFWAPHLVATVG